MLRLSCCVITATAVLMSFTMAQDSLPTAKTASPAVAQMSWQEPSSWIRLVSADERDLHPSKVIQPVLAPALLKTQEKAPSSVPNVPANIKPTPERGPLPVPEGLPNSNLPPSKATANPDSSEMQKTETEQNELGTPQPVLQYESQSAAAESIANGYRFASGDGCGESCGPTSCSNSCFRCLSDECCRDFTFYTGAVFLHRNESKSQRLVVNPADPSQNLNADDFDFGSESGIEVGATAHALFGDADLDLRFFSVGDFHDRERRRTTGSTTRLDMAFPINLSGPRSIVADYSSGLDSFEAGLRYRMGAANDWTTLWIGLRVLDISETMTGSFASPGGTPSTQNLAVSASNRLFGLQIGMDETLLGNQQHSLECYWRAGVYGNDSIGSSRLVSQTAPPVTLRSSGGGGQTSFVGELGLKTKVRLTNNLNLYSRYQMLVAEGVALAGEQFASSSLLSMSGHTTNGGLFYHGAVFGLEYVY